MSGKAKHAARSKRSSGNHKPFAEFAWRAAASTHAKKAQTAARNEAIKHRTAEK